MRVRQPVEASQRAESLIDGAVKPVAAAGRVRCAPLLVARGAPEVLRHEVAVELRLHAPPVRGLQAGYKLVNEEAALVFRSRGAGRVDSP